MKLLKNGRMSSWEGNRATFVEHKTMTNEDNTRNDYGIKLVVLWLCPDHLVMKPYPGTHRLNCVRCSITHTAFSQLRTQTAAQFRKTTVFVLTEDFGGFNQQHSSLSDSRRMQFQERLVSYGRWAIDVKNARARGYLLITSHAENLTLISIKKMHLHFNVQPSQPFYHIQMNTFNTFHLKIENQLLGNAFGYKPTTFWETSVLNVLYLNQYLNSSILSLRTFGAPLVICDNTGESRKSNRWWRSSISSNSNRIFIFRKLTLGVFYKRWFGNLRMEDPRFTGLNRYAYQLWYRCCSFGILHTWSGDSWGTAQFSKEIFLAGILGN